MIKKYWKSLDSTRKQNLANKLNTSSEYLRQVFLYGKPVGAKLAREIELATSGEVGAVDLRPDLFGPISAINSAK